MLDFASDLSPMWAFALLVGLSAVASWAFTEVMRIALADATRRTGKALPPRGWNTLLRLASIAVGTAVGWYLGVPPIGPIVGACSGALNTFLVWVIKKRIRRIADDPSNPLHNIPTGFTDAHGTIPPQARTPESPANPAGPQGGDRD